MDRRDEEGWEQHGVRSVLPGSLQGGHARLRRHLLDHVSISDVDHVIDSDGDPFIPGGWAIEDHQAHGRFRWSAASVQLWLADAQHQQGGLGGRQLRDMLMARPVLNATVLDYLFANPNLIPEEWEGQCVFFWGTIYRRHTGLAVRALFLKDGLLNFGSRLLTRRWAASSPAAILASGAAV